jgi:hypothetical protein
MIDMATLEHLIGRPLSLEHRASISDLNDLPEALVEEARTLGTPILARNLLAYYTTPECRSYLKTFVDDVVFGKALARLWRRGGALVPAPSISEQLCISREVLLAPIGGYSGSRVAPRIESWRAGTSWIGAPAQPRPDANYRTATPSGAALVAQPMLEIAPDVAITVRRWIAGRLARVLVPSEPTSLDALFGFAPYLPAFDQWSEDAQIGVRALLREFRYMGPPKDEIPGFRGPDSWFI